MLDVTSKWLFIALLSLLPISQAFAEISLVNPPQDAQVSMLNAYASEDRLMTFQAEVSNQAC